MDPVRSTNQVTVGEKNGHTIHGNIMLGEREREKKSLQRYNIPL